MHDQKQVRYISSFLFVLIPVLLMGIFFLAYYLNNTRYYIRNERLSSFERTVVQINRMFTYQENIASYLDDQPNLFYAKENGTVSPVDDNLIQSEILHLENMLPSPAEIVVYFRGQNEVYTSEEKMALARFEQSFSSNNVNFVMSSFFTNLNSRKTPFIYRMTPVAPESEKSAIISYIFPLPTMSNTPEMDVVFLTEETAFQDILANLMGDGNINYYMYSSTYGMLVQNDNAISDIQTADIFRATGSGVLEQTIDGQRLVLMRTVSEDMLLTHVAVMTEADFYQDLYRNGLVLLLLIFFLTALCFFLLVWVAYRRYQPIQRLVRSVVGNRRLPKDVTEFDAIEQIHQASLAENEQMSLQLEAQAQIVASHLVLRLITGNFHPEKLPDRFAVLPHLFWESGCKAALCILFPQTSMQIVYMENFPAIQTKFSGKEIQLLTAELMEEDGCCCVWSCRCSPEAGETILRSFVFELLEILVQMVGASPAIGVGTSCTALTELKRSYYEASAALQFSRDENSGTHICFYSDALRPLNTDTISIPHVELRLLTEGIQHGDAEVAASALSAISERLSRESVSLIILRLTCSDVTKALLNLAEQNNLSLDGTILRRLVYFGSFSEFEDTVSELTADMCAQMKARLAHRSTEQREEVFRYIDEKYTDPLFSLEIACSELKITRAKLNLILKEETGTSFWQYVSLLRLEEVKRQLVQNDTPIQDIVRSVGYQDVSNFLRKFREAEGVTAKQYRLQSRTKPDEG